MKQAWMLALAAVVAASAETARAEDRRTVGGPTAEEVRVAAEIHERDIPRCRSGCGDLQDPCGWPLDPCGRRLGRLDLTLEGTVSWLEGPEGPLGEETGAVNAVRWDDLDYEVGIGARASVALRLTTLDRVRARGWWLGGWEDDLSTTGVYGFSPPPTTSPSSTVALAQEADLWSASLDWMRELVCCGIYRLEGFVGPRVTVFDEAATANIASLGVVGAGPTGVVRADAENVFYGAEIGAAATAYATSQWTFGAQGAVLLGILQKEVRVADSGLFTPGAKTAAADEEGFGWGVEVDLGATWRPTPRFGLTVGYQFLHFADVTRAHAAMDFSQFATGQVQARSPDDDVTVHTVFAGVTLNL
jgi:hypothetical protein